MALKEKIKTPFASVLVGSVIDSRTDEHFVAIALQPSSARLSIVGARLLAKQINEWADHAEEKNSTRGDLIKVDLVYRVIQNGLVGAADKSAPEWSEVKSDKVPEGAVAFQHKPVLKAKKPRSRKKK